MASGKEIVNDLVKSKSGRVLSNGENRISAVRDRTGKQIIFHDITNGGVEYKGKRDAIKKIDGLLEAGYS